MIFRFKQNMMFPLSPGERLAQIWNRVVEEVRTTSGGKVRAKVAEKPGVKVSALLVDPLPGEEDSCGTEHCNPCRRCTTKRKSCHKTTAGGMVYEGRCDTWGEVVGDGGNPPTSLHHGRTSWTLYTRMKSTRTGTRKRWRTTPSGNIRRSSIQRRGVNSPSG